MPGLHSSVLLTVCGAGRDTVLALNKKTQEWLPGKMITKMSMDEKTILEKIAKECNAFQVLK